MDLLWSGKMLDIPTVKLLFKKLVIAFSTIWVKLKNQCHVALVM